MAPDLAQIRYEGEISGEFALTVQELEKVDLPPGEVEVRDAGGNRMFRGKGRLTFLEFTQDRLIPKGRFEAVFVLSELTNDPYIPSRDLDPVARIPMEERNALICGEWLDGASNIDLQKKYRLSRTSIQRVTNAVKGLPRKEREPDEGEDEYE